LGTASAALPPIGVLAAFDVVLSALLHFLEIVAGVVHVLLAKRTDHDLASKAASSWDPTWRLCRGFSLAISPGMLRRFRLAKAAFRCHIAPMSSDAGHSNLRGLPGAGRTSLVLVAAAVGLLTAAGLLLWKRNGDAVFGDMVLAALAWCF
jgi:hypothetical protein